MYSTNQIEVNLNDTTLIAKYSFDTEEFWIYSVHVLLHNYESSDIMELLSTSTIEQIENAIWKQAEVD